MLSALAFTQKQVLELIAEIAAGQPKTKLPHAKASPDKRIVSGLAHRFEQGLCGVFQFSAGREIGFIVFYHSQLLLFRTEFASFRIESPIFKLRSSRASVRSFPRDESCSQ